MRADWRVVVSAEATPYLAWQAKLAHYSCLTRLGQAPLIVAHERRAAWPADYDEITRTGGTVLPAPSYRRTARGFLYAARNSAGTLLEAARYLPRSVDTLILCDADVVFTRACRFPRTLSAAPCGYLDYTRPRVHAAMRRLGLPLARVRTYGTALHCGIPYVVPRRHAAELARVWLEASDAFAVPVWEDIMYAFGFAVALLGLPLRRINLAQTNFVAGAAVAAPAIHYCYDNRAWTKRRHASVRAAARVWTSRTRVRRGTVLGEVLGQLREAGRFYAGAACGAPRGSPTP